MMSLFSCDGTTNLVECTDPRTGRGCVPLVYSDHGVLELSPDGVQVGETYGISLDGLRIRTGLDLLGRAAQQ